MKALKPWMLVAAICFVFAGDEALNAGTVFDFSYISTRNAAFNNKAHMLNTGIQVGIGDLVQIQGTGQIHVGGPYYVMSNFDMGLISPLNNIELMRSYQGVVSNYVTAPIPLIGETVLFASDRVSLTDDHDVSLWVTARSAGYIYIGMFDQFFADNTGSHDFRITVIPEPAGAFLAPVLFLILGRRSRALRTIASA
ncbi:MAG: hypothetical protein HS101_06420 [Planctomycetia bacterium]|nr:hypothetical protein [Planctomycetia bacterium]MCC7314146.1 hypothetical protein [Planctomycetota bacterium]